MATKRKTRPRPVYLETTIPVIRKCRSCGVWFAAGVAEGVKAEVDLVVLSPRLIVLAMLTGTTLYVVRRSGLIHMDANRLRGRYLGGLMPQHRCGIVWPRELPGAGVTPGSRYPEQPPF
jgi:hypothetical protein